MSKQSTADSLLIRDSREEAIRRRLEDDERRRMELAEQISPGRTPEARIRIWERRHQLTLPRNPEHQLIDVIATATALTRAEVLEEQRVRALQRLENGMSSLTRP